MPEVEAKWKQTYWFFIRADTVQYLLRLISHNDVNYDDQTYVDLLTITHKTTAFNLAPVLQNILYAG